MQTALHVPLRRGSAEEVTPDLAAVLGRPPRGLETFVADHVDAWR